jgi:hypothetical protein
MHRYRVPLSSIGFDPRVGSLDRGRKSHGLHRRLLKFLAQ